MKNVGEKSFRKYSRLLLLGLFLATVFFVYQATRIGLDYDFEKFYPTSDPETEFFLEYRQKFQSDNDFLLVGIEKKDGVFDESFLRKVDQFTMELKRLDFVDSVASITNQKEFFIKTKTTQRPLINFEDVDLERDSINIYGKPELINSFVAEDAKSICLFIKHEDFLSKKKSDKLIKNDRAEVLHRQNDD